MTSRFVDITGWVENGMWSYSSVYPGAKISECPHPPEFPEEYEVYCQKFELGGQSGTYIETKAHVDRRATPVTECPIEDFVMEATILRVHGKGANQPIVANDLQKARVEIRPDSAVIVSAGWDEHWHNPRNFLEGSPYIDRDAARWLLAQGIRCLAADFPRFDNISSPCFPWGEFWEAVPYLLAPLCNVYGHDFVHALLYAFPLKIRGAMGTPVRAVLEVRE
jgi:kynurenine formamidase